MNIIDLKQRLAEAQQRIRQLEDELAETNRGLVALTMELEQRVDQRTAALQASEVRERERAAELATLLDAVPTPVFIAHDATGAHITGNRAADELLQHPRGREASLSAPTSARPRHFRAVVKDGRELGNDELPAQRAARGEPVSDFEFSLVFDDGIVRDVVGYGTPLWDDQGRPRGAVHVLVDITARKQAEETLRQSEERYHNLFDSMIEGFCTIGMIFDADGRPVDYRFLDVNPAVERQTGLHNVQGRRVRELIPDNEPYWYEVFGKVALTGEPARLEREAKGLGHWYEVSAYRVGGPQSRKVAILFNDITARKQGEEKLQELNDALEQRVAERTAEVQNLADQLRALAAELSQVERRERKRLAQILHDHIQQLLVAAKMRVEMLQHNPPVDGRGQILQNILAILQEATDASRSLAVELSPPVLHEAGLSSALSWLASQLMDKHQFSVHVRCDAGAEPAAEEIRLLLFECVRELLFNAVKHAGVHEAQVTLGHEDNGSIRLVVRDQGAGFDPQQLSRRSTAEITFGLFSIQQRLAHLGGHMKIDAAPGQGTRITLTVPLA